MAAKENKEALLSSLPEIKTSGLRTVIQKEIQDSEAPLLITLDDDPTGTQTCHDIAVLTTWDEKTISEEMNRTALGGGFFILTNSRSLYAEDAKKLIRETISNIQAASKKTGKPFEIVLRSDSTLRGHFPDELDAAEEIIGKADLWLLVPFFLQGGRFTINDVHYVAEDHDLVPAGDTQFAKDETFGYENSNLRDWVVEKSQGVVSRDRTLSLSIEDIRQGGLERVHEVLMKATKGSVVVVNAAAEEDIDVVILGILKVREKGKSLLYRTGAAFVSARLGISPIPPISPHALPMSANSGGLIVAGSHVPKTTAQLDHLIQNNNELKVITLQVEDIIKSENDANTVIHSAWEETEAALSQKQDVLIMTSRKLITSSDKAKSLDIGTAVAKCLVDLVKGISITPRYIIAKGGITSSDLATKALGMKRAQITGQATAGVPLWQCFEESCKYPGLPYVVFPGNVGSREALEDLVRSWRADQPHQQPSESNPIGLAQSIVGKARSKYGR